MHISTNAESSTGIADIGLVRVPGECEPEVGMSEESFVRLLLAFPKGERDSILKEIQIGATETLSLG